MVHGSPGPRAWSTQRVPGLIAAMNAFGVDREEHFDATPGPLCDLGRRDACVEPQRYAAAAKVIRTLRQC